ncbi:guanine nucleotide binding protein, alpha subunit [Gautieria morchelliformis]|nr:guanine nucleotide binding protein, alpha subunit [Gautieria morchelliformis]
MLILGAPRAGKSTLLKRIHDAVNQQDITGSEYYRERVINDVVHSMKAIIKAREAEELAMPSDLPHSISLADAELTIMKLPANLLHVLIHWGASLPFKMEDVSRAICILWNTPAIRRLVRRLEARRSLMPNATYFLDAADRIFTSDYIPTGEDILRYQQGSESGLCGSILKSGSATCHLIEVPWKHPGRSLVHGLHRYGTPEVVLFVAALSDYNQEVYESNMTVMDESLASFEATVNSRRLTNALIVLVFSKYEKFEEELSYLPLEYWIPAYQGHTFEEASRFIEKQYVDLVEGKDCPFITYHLRPGQGASTLGLIDAIKVKIAERWQNPPGSIG